MRKLIRTNILVRGLFVLVLSILVGCSTIPEQPENLQISSITVVLDNNYPPYVFVDEKGNLQGILVDQWRKWERYTGVRADLIGLPWGEALDRMKVGEFDVIDTLFYTEERAKLYEYGNPYAKINVRIFFRKNISGISNAENLKGFRVAVKKGDANVEYLLGHDITSLLYYDSYKEIVLATANNEENIFVMDEPPAFYYLFKNGIQDEFNYSEPLYSGEFHRAVRKGDTAILELVNRGFANISPQEYREIDNRWFGTRQTSELAFIMPYLGGGLLLALVVIISLGIFNTTLQARVTKRTKELEKSEALFRDSIEFLPIPIGITDSQGNLLEINRKFTEHYGYTLKDIETIDKWIKLASPDPEYREAVSAQWNADVATALRYETNTPLREYRITGKDGQVHDVEIIMRPVGDLWVTSFSEITERKKSEEKLKASREQYRAVVENQTEFIVRWKPDRTRTFVNEAYCRYFGLTLEQAMNVDFLSLIVDEDRPSVQENIFRVDAGITHAHAETHRVIKPDGSFGWHEWIDTAIRDESGKVVEFQSVGRDITERKLAEEKLHESEVRYRTLFEDSPVPLLEEDFSAVKDYIDELRESGIKDFRSYFENHPEDMNKCINMVEVMDVNKAAIKWQGSLDKDELTGSLGQFISALETQSFIEELISLMEDGTYYESTISRTTKDGDPIHLIVNGTVAPGYENTWGRVLVSILDITESKIAEENLIKAYDTTLWGWAKALEFRDKETEGHSRRVVEITLKFAQALGIVDEDELVNIRRGAILHDIGKLSIPDEILLKPGQLTEGEWQIMSQHPWIGYKLLAPIEFLSGSLDIVRYHHEKWDGSGYLSGLKGEEIPLAARIFAVVDVWDAVQAERPYKKAWTRKKAIQHLQAEAGNQFDPHIVTVFLDLVEQGKI